MYLLPSQRRTRTYSDGDDRYTLDVILVAPAAASSCHAMTISYIHAGKRCPLFPLPSGASTAVRFALVRQGEHLLPRSPLVC